MARKPILYLLLVLILVVAFLVTLGLISPKSAVAPAEQSTFEGPPLGSLPGFNGPTSSPPSSLEIGD
ncbi:MAG: hypothetical protein V2A55_03315 [Candidatus Jorgensenbacteria bacterium]